MSSLDRAIPRLLAASRALSPVWPSLESKQEVCARTEQTERRLRSCWRTWLSSKAEAGLPRTLASLCIQRTVNIRRATFQRLSEGILIKHETPNFREEQSLSARLWCSKNIQQTPLIVHSLWRRFISSPLITSLPSNILVSSSSIDRIRLEIYDHMRTEELDTNTPCITMWRILV